MGAAPTYVGLNSSYFFSLCLTSANLSFAEKRDRTNSQKLYVGYKNGLEINKNLAEKDAWTVQDIIDRTNELVAQLLVMYKL